MNTYELFIDNYKLPKPLSKEEINNLFKQAKNGSKDARNKIITHSIKLVLYEVTSKFSNVDYDKKELVSIGNLGLVKAVDTYDLSKKYEFSTYAIRCIDNEIIMFLRELKKNNSIDSLDRVVFSDKHGNELKLKDQISDDRDLVEENETVETHEIIREIVMNLPNRDKEIIMLYFGFYNDKIYKQEEIANKLHISQSQISRLIRKIVKQIGKILESKCVVELNSNQFNSGKETEKKMKRLLLNPIGKTKPRKP